MAALLMFMCAAAALLPGAAAAKFTVSLSKQHVPVVVDNRTLLHKTAYFGTVHVGLPEMQTFTVVFDTGSGHFFLPSTECTNEACLHHKRYNRSLSRSAIDVNYDGSRTTSPHGDRDQVSITYGTGDVVGEFAHEVLCVDKPLFNGSVSAEDIETRLDEFVDGEEPEKIVALPTHCTRLRLISAREMSSDPFRLFQFDGVIGLGLHALALDPEFHFFGKLTNSHPGMTPIFGVFLSVDDDDSSQITFGGHDPSRIAEDKQLQWSSVLSPEQGYWRVGVRGVRVGNKSVEICETGQCSAIVDTGTSLLGVPRKSMRSIFTHTAREVAKSVPADGVDCRHIPGPPLIFDMGGFELTIEADAYTRPAAVTLTAPQQRAGNTSAAARPSTEGASNASTNASSARVICQALLLPVDMLDSRVFLFGEPLLQRYYTAYDAYQKKVGFAPVRRQPRIPTAEAAVEV